MTKPLKHILGTVSLVDGFYLPELSVNTLGFCCSVATVLLLLNCSAHLSFKERPNGRTRKDNGKKNESLLSEFDTERKNFCLYKVKLALPSSYSFMTRRTSSQ